MYASTRAAVFLLAAAEDRDAVQRLRDHLRPLLGEVETATDIPPGEPRDTWLGRRIDAAALVVLLISRHAVNGEEASRGRRANQDRQPIIPVRWRSVPLPDWLDALEALPRGGKPISERPAHSHDAAWSSVAKEIKAVLDAQGQALEADVQCYRAALPLSTPALDPLLRNTRDREAPKLISLFVMPRLAHRETRQETPLRDALDANRWLLIRGNPGGGKSTLTRWLALMLCQPEGLASVLLPNLVPVRVELRRLDAWQRNRGGDWDVFAFLDAQEPRLPQASLAALERAGRLFWIFDGLDEVLDEQRREGIAAALLRLKQRSQGRGLITCRSNAASKLVERSALTEYMILDFGAPQVESAVAHWYQAHERQDENAREEQQRLVRALKEDATLAALARSPLLLRLLLELSGRGDLPRGRARILRHALDVRLEDWDARRAIGPAPFDLETEQHFLRVLAWSLLDGTEDQRRRPRLTVAVGALEDLAAEFLRGGREAVMTVAEARRQAERLVEHLRERAGILDDLGDGTFGFVHHVFFEYFAAEEACERYHREGLVFLNSIWFRPSWGAAQQDSWREVFFLLVELLGDGTKTVQLLRESLVGLSLFPLRSALDTYLAFCLELIAWHRRRVGAGDRGDVQGFLDQLLPLVAHVLVHRSDAWREPEEILEVLRTFPFLGTERDSWEALGRGHLGPVRSGPRALEILIVTLPAARQRDLLQHVCELDPEVPLRLLRAKGRSQSYQLRSAQNRVASYVCQHPERVQEPRLRRAANVWFEENPPPSDPSEMVPIHMLPVAEQEAFKSRMHAIFAAYAKREQALRRRRPYKDNEWEEILPKDADAARSLLADLEADEDQRMRTLLKLLRESPRPLVQLRTAEELARPLFPTFEAWSALQALSLGDERRHIPARARAALTTLRLVRALYLQGQPPRRRREVRLAGVPTGLITETATGTAFFYDLLYLSNPASVPILPTLPLQVMPITSPHLQPFFAKLMREGSILDLSAQELGLSRDDGFDPVGTIEVFTAPEWLR